MTLFTIFLIVIVILAVVGLGWKSFTVGVLDGFDKTLDIGIPIIKNLTSETQEAQASTIEIPTTDPPMSHGAELNGTKTIDYISSEVAHQDSAKVVIPWYNFTILLDVPEYQECLARGDDLHSMKTLQNATEVERRAALSPEMLKATGMNGCIAIQYVAQGIEKAFEGV